MFNILLEYENTVPSTAPQIAKFMGPTWAPPGSCRPQVGPMPAPWTLLAGHVPHSKGLRYESMTHVGYVSVVIIISSLNKPAASLWTITSIAFLWMSFLSMNKATVSQYSYKYQGMCATNSELSLQIYIHALHFISRGNMRKQSDCVTLRLWGLISMAAMSMSIRFH